VIQRLADIELAEFEHVHWEGTRIVAVALVRVAGAEVEPLFLSTEENGELRIEAEVELPLGINLHALFGGLRFTSLPELTRSRITGLIVERACEVFT